MVGLREIVRIAGRGLKVRAGAVDDYTMLILLALLTAGYFAAVVWVRRGTKQRRAAAIAAVEPVALPADDQPPSSAVGWPPGGSQFTAYVDQGFQALDAYLAEGFAT